MGRKLVIKVPHRRRREQKTDYRQRLELLKSGRPRFVVRRSLNNTRCQIIEHNPKGDITKAAADTGELEGFGWKGSSGNMPAAYLAGLLCGVRAGRKGIKEAILDIGLLKSMKGSRTYGALKGALDAGLEIPHSEDILPDVKRIAGEHISGFAKQLKGAEHDRMFSSYLKKKLKPEELPKHFEEVRARVMKGGPAEKAAGKDVKKMAKRDKTKEAVSKKKAAKKKR